MFSIKFDHLSRRLFGLTLGCLTAKPLVAADQTGDEFLWAALKSGGYIILLRHALTEPGIGDPPGFKVGECRTQRNLSVKGRADAQHIGQAFEARYVPVQDVLSSRWCRCIDTAQLAFKRVKPAFMLDSVFNDPENVQKEKTSAVSAFIADNTSSGNMILVTHAQNIQALTGISPLPGEMVIVSRLSPKTFEVIGRLAVQNN